jgi:hypothetical protein
VNQFENGKNPGSQANAIVNNCITSSQWETRVLNSFRVSGCAELGSGNTNEYPYIEKWAGMSTEARKWVQDT